MYQISRFSAVKDVPVSLTYRAGKAEIISGSLPKNESSVILVSITNQNSASQNTINNSNFNTLVNKTSFYAMIDTGCGAKHAFSSTQLFFTGFHCVSVYKKKIPMLINKEMPYINSQNYSNTSYQHIYYSIYSFVMLHFP